MTRQPPRLSRSDQPIVFLRDVSPVHFERLLQFMYCGEVRVPNNELEDLLATATSLKVRGLANTHERLLDMLKINAKMYHREILGSIFILS